MVYLPTAGSRGRDKSGDGREIGRGALTDWRGQKESGRKKASERARYTHHLEIAERGTSQDPY